MKTIYQLVATVISTAALAATVGAVGAAEPIRLTVDEAVAMALENHPSVHASAAARDVSLANVAEAESGFAPTLEAQALHQTDRASSVSSLEQVAMSTTNYQTLTLGLVKPLKTGGRVAITVDQNRTSDNAAFRTINPVYGSRLRMEVRQPLARGRGRVNRAEIEIAEQYQTASQVEYEARRREVETAVRSAYWDLFLARANLQVKRQLLEGGERVLETVRTRVAAGSDAESAVLEARVGLAAREEDVVIAEDGVRDEEDWIRYLLVLESTGSEIIPVDTPALQMTTPDLGAGTRSALELSERLAKAAASSNITQLEIDVARDGTRPTVDLLLTAELNGLGSDFQGPWNGLGGGEGRSLYGGLTFSLPIGGSPQDARLAKALWEKTRADLDRAQVQMEAVRRVKERHRQITTDLKRAQAAELAEELATRNVREAEQRLKLGMMTPRDVLDTQDELAEASMRRMTAVVDSRKAAAEWFGMTGERLE